jgi:hypothetical protein
MAIDAETKVFRHSCAADRESGIFSRDHTMIDSPRSPPRSARPKAGNETLKSRLSLQKIHRHARAQDAAAHRGRPRVPNVTAVWQPSYSNEDPT